MEDDEFEETDASLDLARSVIATLITDSAIGLRSVLGPLHAGRLRVGSASASVLSRLSRVEGNALRMADLVTLTGFTPGGLTGAVDRLVEAGLVTRRSGEIDRREIYVVLTAKGLERIHSAVLRGRSLTSLLFDDLLDAEEIRTLEPLLRRIRDRVNPTAAALLNEHNLRDAGTSQQR